MRDEEFEDVSLGTGGVGRKWVESNPQNQLGTENFFLSKEINVSFPPCT